jgi:hypothetical protein
VGVADKVVGIELRDGFYPANLAEVLQDMWRNAFQRGLTPNLKVA